MQSTSSKARVTTQWIRSTGALFNFLGVSLRPALGLDLEKQPQTACTQLSTRPEARQSPRKRVPGPGGNVDDVIPRYSLVMNTNCWPLKAGRSPGTGAAAGPGARVPRPEPGGPGVSRDLGQQAERAPGPGPPHPARRAEAGGRAAGPGSGPAAPAPPGPLPARPSPAGAGPGPTCAPTSPRPPRKRQYILTPLALLLLLLLQSWGCFSVSGGCGSRRGSAGASAGCCCGLSWPAAPGTSALSASAIPPPLLRRRCEEAPSVTMAAAGGAVTDPDLKRPRALSCPDLARTSRGPAMGRWGGGGRWECGGGRAGLQAPVGEGQGCGGPGTRLRGRRPRSGREGGAGPEPQVGSGSAPLAGLSLSRLAPNGGVFAYWSAQDVRNLQSSLAFRLFISGRSSLNERSRHHCASLKASANLQASLRNPLNNANKIPWHLNA